MNISEYLITVNPKCKNTIAELSTYCWEKGAENVPEDKNNHLLDAMRYAFFDVKRGGREEIASYGKPLKGGWDI